MFLIGRVPGASILSVPFRSCDHLGGIGVFWIKDVLMF